MTSLFGSIKSCVVEAFQSKRRMNNLFEIEKKLKKDEHL